MFLDVGKKNMTYALIKFYELLAIKKQVQTKNPKFDSFIITKCNNAELNKGQRRTREFQTREAFVKKLSKSFIISL